MKDYAYALGHSMHDICVVLAIITSNFTLTYNDAQHAVDPAHVLTMLKELPATISATMFDE